MSKIILCADSESLIRPTLIGLNDITLTDEKWLIPISDALEARNLVRNRFDISEAWVIATDQVESLNLIAALRKDKPDILIYLVAFESTERISERLSTLGVTKILNEQAFRERFNQQKAAHQSIASTSCVRDKTCYTLSILSGSGGVGKSSFASIGACIAQSRGFRTVLIDADSQFGDIRKMIDGGISIPFDELLEDATKLDDSSIDFEGKLPITITSPSKLETSERLQGKLNEIVSICSRKFDVVIIDTGLNWSDDHVWALENSDCCLFMLDQRASSIRSVQRAIDLCMRMGIASGSFVYALNRCSRNSIFSGMDIANIMQGAHVAELKDGESEVEEYLGSGLCLELSNLKNDFVTSIDALLGDLLPASTFFSGSPKWSIPKEEERQGFLSREQKGFFFLERRDKKKRKNSRSSNQTIDPGKLQIGVDHVIN